MTDLRILLATPHAGYEQRVRQAFGGLLNGDLRRWDAALGAVSPDGLLRQLSDAQPDVVAIGPGLDLDTALAMAAQLEQDRPEISVLLISETEPALWERAMRAGIRDVLDPSAVDADVRAAFDRALHVAEGRRRNLVGVPDAAPSGRIITVLSPKGGSGKTTLASNLAVGLALAEPNKVAIVDLDLQFGDVSSALRMNPETSIVDAVRAPGHQDAMTLKTFLTAHPSGLWALCGPDAPAEGELVTAEQAKAVVQTLAGEFRYVVVDTCAGLTEHTLSVLEVSTDLILMCAMDVLSVRSLRKEVDALEQLGMTHQRRHFVINRADSKVGLDIKDVEATVGQPVDVAVSSSRVVPLSMNQGSPVVESEPRSQVAKQFTSLVHKFAEQPQQSGFSLLRRSGR
ncbi:CpaE family protein [Egicoccus sp. AB-alg2]|uniref:AAA family ATPase n=1 Tax=Egicoccus sp. AB-alg2 TaxID=3242693 RepID=UPI00359E561D